MRRAPLLLLLALLAGCVAAGPPPIAAPVTPGSPSPDSADAALARDAALATVPGAEASATPRNLGASAPPGNPGATIGPPVIVHATGPDGPVDVATIALPDAVLFDFGMAEPRAGSAPVLLALARAIAASPPGTVATVAGNTDAIGSDDYNQALSEGRARNVVVALARLGVDPARLRATGFGRHRPVATNDTPAGRARNRRVDVALSPSFADNLAALVQAAPVIASVPNAAAMPPPPPPPDAPPGAAWTAPRTVPASPSDAAVTARRPSTLRIRPNTPSSVRPNRLGPTMSY